MITKLDVRKELSRMAANLLCAADDLKAAREHEETGDLRHAIVYLTEVRDFCGSVRESAIAVLFEMEQLAKEQGQVQS